MELALGENEPRQTADDEQTEVHGAMGTIECKMWQRPRWKRQRCRIQAAKKVKQV